MAASIIYCRSCGRQNNKSDDFCSFCGYELTTSGAGTPVLSTPTGQLQAQTLLRQRYRVLQTIGKGGMGAVYLAQDTQLGDRPVAVKEMSQSNLYGQQALDATEQFKNEAHLLAGLQHPNLPSIHDYFEENGRWYLVMSFIQGETLADYLDHAQNKRLPLEEVLSIGRDLCNVLHYLHTHQPPIIFRDLKPSNIMRSSDGHLYLIDFGIARHFKPGQEKDTASYGSMGYAPPEQYGRAQTTERSDIYSLGATLYELLSGYDPSLSPFRLPPLQSQVPTLPDRLVRLITQMLELDESKRPANVQSIQQELQQVSAGSAPVQTPYAPPAPPPVSHIPVTPLPPTQYAPPPPPSAQYRQGQQIFLPPNSTPALARPSPVKRVFAVIGKILSIIGVIMGVLSILLGIFGTFENDGFITNLWFGALFIFLGLMIIFIALIRKSPLPVSKGRKAKAIIGRIIVIIGSISGIIITILGVMASFTSNSSDSGGALAGVIVIIECVVIWLVTRIRIKKTP